MPKDKLIIEIECEPSNSLKIISSIKKLDCKITLFSVESCNEPKKVGF
jgi:hypothetical protein